MKWARWAEMSTSISSSFPIPSSALSAGPTLFPVKVELKLENLITLIIFFTLL